MEIMLGKLQAPVYFEVSTEPSWWVLADNMKMNLGEHRYAVCVTTGQVKRFSVEQMVKLVNLSIYRT